ncbi:MAG: SDR family oxidoreductase [bacterium]|nr:SDR family oxidoreductase [bacterium]
MILIIGATGTVGREVVKLLTAKDTRIRVLTRRPDATPFTASPILEIVSGDLNGLDSLKPAMRGVTRVFISSSSDRQQVELQGNAVKAAVQEGVRHIVKLSTLGAKPDSPITLSRMHHQTEQQIIASGLDYTLLRPHNFMQNTLLFARSIISEGAFYAPLGDARISMVDARDVAAVAASALSGEGHEGKIYSITGPEAISYNQAAREISAIVGRRITYVSLSEGDASRAMLESGNPEWMVEDLIRLYRQFRKGGGELVTQTVQEITGREPINFNQFIRDYAHVFRGDTASIPQGTL